MTRSLHAIFDGKVLCPEETVDLQVNRHYLLTIEPVGKIEGQNDLESDPAFNLSSLAVKTGIPDLATEHDHYLYGILKRGVDIVSKKKILGLAENWSLGFSLS